MCRVSLVLSGKLPQDPLRFPSSADQATLGFPPKDHQVVLTRPLLPIQSRALFLGHPGGFSALNQKDLKRYKKMLEESRDALLQSAKKTLMEESNFDTDDLPDEIDLASSEYTQSMVFRLRDREKFLLKKIEKAITRIDDGTFGICERCEEPISPKRLDARPVTTLCIRCKEEQEKKEKSYG